MKKNNTGKKGMSTGSKIAIAAGAAALGAGAYYLLGPNKKAHQKKAKVWMAKMKKEVASKIRKAKNVTMPLYNKAVDSISADYSKQYKMHEGQIKAFAKQLKGEWKNAPNFAKKSVKKAVTKAKRSLKNKRS